MINDDYDYEFEGDEEDLDEEDLIIQAAVAAAVTVAAVVVGLSANGSGSRISYSSTALDGIKESLDMIANSLRELGSEHTLRRLQLDARPDAGRRQGGKAESPQRRHEAMQRVQQIETHLDDSRLIALADLVAKDTNAADTYMSIEREDYRHAWVALKLKEMGFIEGISI